VEFLPCPQSVQSVVKQYLLRIRHLSVANHGTSYALLLIPVNKLSTKNPHYWHPISIKKSISQCLICGKRPDGTLIGAMYCPECYIKKHPVSKQSTQPPPQSLPLNAPLPGFVVKTPLLQNSSNEWTDSDNSDNDWDKDDEPLKSTQAPKFSNDNDSDSDWDEDEQTSVKKPVQKKKLLLKDNNKQQKDSLQLKDNLITRRFFEQIDIE